MPGGQCLCGGVKYEIDGNTSQLWLCHCSMCRRSSGSAFHAVTICRSSRFRWVCGEDRIHSHCTPSGYETRFCGSCGSPLPQVREDAGQVILLAGALDASFDRPIARHIFVGSKAPWYAINDDAPQFEEHAPGRED